MFVLLEEPLFYYISWNIQTNTFIDADVSATSFNQKPQATLPPCKCNMHSQCSVMDVHVTNQSPALKLLYCFITEKRQVHPLRYSISTMKNMLHITTIYTAETRDRDQRQ